MVFSEFESILNLIEKAKNYYKSFNKEAPSTITSRFIQIFEAHGVHRNQIPRFFGHGFSLKDLQDEASLIVKLDEEVMEAVCKLFAIRRQWLDGADKQIHPCHDFYKEPGKFLTFINELKLENPTGQLDGVLYTPDNKDFHAEAILVLNETIGYLDNEAIYRYHLCNNWAFTYWKARGYLTACIAIAWKHKIYVRGIEISRKLLDSLFQGNKFLACPKSGVSSRWGKRWYAEDMALVPETFLKYIDPELNKFGIKSALNMWLDLDKQGLMETNLPNVDCRQLFIEARKKYV